ncbi:MAG: endolytic transglycosylase MltG [Bacteroidia bacterium]|jgi:UPF0755 protein
MPKKKTIKKTPAKKGFIQKNKAILMMLAVAFFFLLAGSIFFIYHNAFKSNLRFKKPTEFVYIRSNFKFDDVVRYLSSEGLLESEDTFRWMADFMGYTHAIKPGRYKIKPGMSNRELIALLQSGQQEPVRLTFKSIRTRHELASKVSKYLEADSTSIIRYMDSEEFQKTYGLNAENALSLIMPNTYEFYWNTSAEGFMKKMAGYYQDFWDNKRKTQAQKLGLRPDQISVIASIVQQESNKKDEWPTIAGVYLNRLNCGMKLQADPTVKFALGNFGLRRILKEHLSVDSPYNTYKYEGLPPGPIYMANSSCIDAVLEASQHEFIYFCARPDRSGYHDFAKTYSEHLANAAKYHRELNRRGI